jgi:hypothetical protein
MVVQRIAYIVPYTYPCEVLPCKVGLTLLWGNSWQISGPSLLRRTHLGETTFIASITSCQHEIKFVMLVYILLHMLTLHLPKHAQTGYLLTKALAKICFYSHSRSC